MTIRELRWSTRFDAPPTRRNRFRLTRVEFEDALEVAVVEAGELVREEDVENPLRREGVRTLDTASGD